MAVEHELKSNGNSTSSLNIISNNNQSTFMNQEKCASGTDLPARVNKSESPTVLAPPMKADSCVVAMVSPKIEPTHMLAAQSMPSIDVHSSPYRPIEYDSDSSHSGFQPTDLGYHSSISPHTSPYQLTDMSGTALANGINADDLYLRNHTGYYGSHQNLAVWNPGVHPLGSQGFYSTSSLAHIDPRIPYGPDCHNKKW